MREQTSTPSLNGSRSWIGGEQRRVVLQKGLEGMGQDLVRAVADEHLLGRHAIARRDRLTQAGRARIGVEAQTIRGGGDGGQDARRRSVGILVGVELDDAVSSRLLAGHVGRQVVNDRTPETAHDP